MKYKHPFVSPDKHFSLVHKKNHDTNERYLIDEDENIYPFIKNIPDLTFPRELEIHDQKVKDFYNSRAEVYDKFLPLTFKTYFKNELEVRNDFITALNINKGNKVLEVACGTGRDSELIAKKLGTNGELCLQDISPLMLKKCIERLKDNPIKTHFCVSNACYLPFPSRYFDATYSFGGLGEFSDIRKSLMEMVRVTKLGGKIVVGDESMPPWLRETEFSKILTTTNPQFEAELPLNQIPIEARELRLRWVIGGVFYLIDFEVGNGEPDADFDFEIPGERGGTYRTRYEGQLEGVTKEVKKLAYDAIRKKGISMHKWLDNIVRQAAQNDLTENDK